MQIQERFLKFMKIGYSPYESKTNKYVELSKKALESEGYKLSDFDNMSWKDRQSLDVVFLNWYESIDNSNSTINFLIIAFKKVLKLLWLKKNKVTVVTTFHNKVPHDTSRFEGKIAWAMLYCTLKIANKIIILSQESCKYLQAYLKPNEIQDKIFYIPHPNYIGVYSDGIMSEQFRDETNMKLLFVGQVRKYKNIELILEVARRTKDLRIQYKIAGKCISDAYKEELKSLLLDNDNVCLDLRFVDDEEIEKMICQSDIMILPYDLKSSLNSGTVYLAFSNKRSVICPMIATIKEFDSDLLYTYEYDDEEEHLEKLLESVKSAYADWENSRESFVKKGCLLYDEVRENNSLEVIAHRYRELIKSF